MLEHQRRRHAATGWALTPMISPTTASRLVVLTPSAVKSKALRLTPSQAARDVEGRHDADRERLGGQDEQVRELVLDHQL
jgi:hypothetical protein